MSSVFVDLGRKIGEEAVPIPPQAYPHLHRITGMLARLEQSASPSPLSASFKERYASILSAVESFQKVVVERSAYSVTCKKRCTACCNHWVEDVNSFEAIIIADYLKKNQPDRLDNIRQQCEADCRELERLELLVNERLYGNENIVEKYSFDSVDLLLNVFYQMQRPCPLLTAEGDCSVYHLRPITCRMYVSFSDPLHCSAEYINSNVVPTCLIDLSEEANQIIDTLHFRYLRYEGDTGLRSLLVKHLSE